MSERIFKHKCSFLGGISLALLSMSTIGLNSLDPASANITMPSSGNKSHHIAIAQATRFPANIVGTYTGKASGTKVITTINFKIIEQRPKDTSQVSECNYVSGEASVDTRTGRLDGYLAGYYCPGKGTFALLFKRKGDNEPMQLYEGNITGNSMQGYFHYLSGDWGKYDFSVSK